MVGDYAARVTPVPIPNTVVKPRWADGTAQETVWESTTSPAFIFESPLTALSVSGLSCFYITKVTKVTKDTKGRSSGVWVYEKSLREIRAQETTPLRVLRDLRVLREMG